MWNPLQAEQVPLEKEDLRGLSNRPDAHLARQRRGQHGPGVCGDSGRESLKEPLPSPQAGKKKVWVTRMLTFQRERRLRIEQGAGRGILYPNGRSQHYSQVFYDGARAACLPDWANGTSAFLLPIVSERCIYKWNSWTLTAAKGGRRGRALGETLISKVIVLFLFQITTRSPPAPKVSVDTGAYAFEIWQPEFLFAFRLLHSARAMPKSECEHRAVEQGLA